MQVDTRVIRNQYLSSVSTDLHTKVMLLLEMIMLRDGFNELPGPGLSREDIECCINEICTE